MLNCSGVYTGADGRAVNLEVLNLIRTLTTKKVFRTIQTVGLTPEALLLGDVVTRGFLILVNAEDASATSYIEVLSSTGGVIVGKMFATEPYGPVRLGSGMQSPFVVATVSECEMEIFLCAV